MSILLHKNIHHGKQKQSHLEISDMHLLMPQHFLNLNDWCCVGPKNKRRRRKKIEEEEEEERR
jgi:hypothetical protein